MRYYHLSNYPPTEETKKKGQQKKNAHTVDQFCRNRKNLQKTQLRKHNGLTTKQKTIPTTHEINI